jgi:hypothetical protein
MTVRYSVMLGYNSSSMQEVALTGFWDANASTLQRMAREQDAASPIRLTFDFNAPDVPPIREWMQIWAGWKEGSAWLQGPDPPFLGFIVQLEGSGAAGHVITGQVQTMQYLMARATVVGWPTGESDGIPTAGYGANYSVANWLVGTSPYPGVVRAYIPNALYDGVDPYFESLVLDATAIPGGNTEALVGQWGFGTLETILQDIVGVARYVAARDDGLLIEPLSWWRTVVQGSTLRPQFRFIDANDTDSKPIKGVFSISPAAGEFYMEDFHHTRDGKDVRTDVVVKGIGSDPVTGELVMARFQDHIADYECEYLPHGIGGDPYFDTSIDTVAKAQAVAAAIGYRVWGALGAINWRTDGQAVGGTALTYFEPGDVIALYDPAEGQFNTRYVVRKVTPDGGTAGHPTYRIEVGDVLPNIKDLIRGATIVQPHRRAVATGSGTNTRGASLGTHGLPGAPPQVPMEARPLHSQQNNMRAAFTDVVDFTTDQPTQLPPGADPDNPPEPAKRQLHRDQYGNHRQWLGPEGADAVQHWSFPVSAAGTVPISVPDPATYVEERLLFLDGSDASGSVTTSYALNGSPVSNPTVSTPLAVVRDQVLAITFAGTFTNPISFKLTSSPPPVVP